MLNDWNKFFWCAVFVCTAFMLQAQSPQDNSPYSRFGLGDLTNQQFAASTGMGRLSAAWNDPYHSNLSNPASLAFLRSTAFEVGINAEYTTLDNGSEKVGIWNGNLQYLSLSFPIRNSINKALERESSDFDWGMGFTLAPYSNVGYDIRITDYSPEVDTTLNIFQGTGGTYRLMWGNAFRYKNLAVGVNIGSLFGKIERSTRTLFTEIPGSYSNFFTDEISVRGFVWNAGLQYKQPLKKNEKGVVTKSLTFGAYGNSATNFNANTSQEYIAISSNTFDSDTISFSEEIITEGRLPTNFTVGLMYEELNKMRLGVEYGVGNWDEFTFDTRLTENSLEQMTFISLGAEFTPDATSYNSYAKRVSYRAGFNYGIDPRGTDGDLTTTGISFGMGMPVTLPRQGVSFFDWAIEIGQFGKSDENALKETYARLTLGFALNDNTWFYKRRFN